MTFALPVLMADLGVPPSVGQWLTGGFLLTMAVVIPITGAAGVAVLVTALSLRSAHLAAMGASVVERTAGGVHVAFVVAAVLSLAGILGACLFRTSERATAPAGRLSRAQAARLSQVDHGIYPNTDFPHPADRGKYAARYIP